MGLPVGPPPPTTKYSKIVLPAGEPAAETQSVPGPVKICVLKFPQVIVVFPPVAAGKGGAPANVSEAF